jgi:hypothetical protein
MVELSDSLIARRAHQAERMTELMDSDRRVGRCTSIDFALEGGAVLAVTLVPKSDAKSSEAIARELEFAITEALPGLPWVRVQVV